jgi:hypothetical protein
MATIGVLFMTLDSSEAGSIVRRSAARGLPARGVITS